MGGGLRYDRESYASGAGGGGSYNSTISDYSEDEGQKKVFTSFAMEDKYAADLIRSQAKKEGSDLDFKDTSLKKPVEKGSWKKPVGKKIEKSDALIVMVGKDTYKSEAVEWEIEKAQKEGVPVVPVKVHKNENPKMPKPIKGKAQKWDLDKIQDKIEKSSNNPKEGKTKKDARRGK